MICHYSLEFFLYLKENPSVVFMPFCIFVVSIFVVRNSTKYYTIYAFMAIILYSILSTGWGDIINNLLIQGCMK